MKYSLHTYSEIAGESFLYTLPRSQHTNSEFFAWESFIYTQTYFQHFISNSIILNEKYSMNKSCVILITTPLIIFLAWESFFSIQTTFFIYPIWKTSQRLFAWIIWTLDNASIYSHLWYKRKYINELSWISFISFIHNNSVVYIAKSINNILEL